MSKRILLTGGSGLLALNWALMVRDDYLVTLGCHTRKIDIEKVNTRHLRFDSSDILMALFDEIRPDVVVHTAAMTNVEQCEADPDAAHYVNTVITRNLALACERSGIYLVHISTDHLFSGARMLVNEDEPLAPVNTYARTKADAEAVVLQICKNSMVIRSNFFCWGPGYRHSFSDSVVYGLREKKNMLLFNDVYYTPILAEALITTVHQLIDRKETGILHVVGDERISKYDFGIRLANIFGLDPSCIRSGSIAEFTGLVLRPHDMSLSNMKVCRLLERKMGGVDESLQRLKQQEKSKFIQEITAL